MYSAIYYFYVVYREKNMQLKTIIWSMLVPRLTNHKIPKQKSNIQCTHLCKITSQISITVCSIAVRRAWHESFKLNTNSGRVCFTPDSSRSAKSAPSDPFILQQGVREDNTLYIVAMHNFSNSLPVHSNEEKGKSYFLFTYQFDISSRKHDECLDEHTNDTNGALLRQTHSRM